MGSTMWIEFDETSNLYHESRMYQAKVLLPLLCPVTPFCSPQHS